MKNVFVNILERSENLNAFALVHGCRLNKPHVLLAMLDWYALFLRSSPCDFFKSAHHLSDLILVGYSRDDESSRSGIECSIVGSRGSLNLHIVSLERSD